MVMIDKETGHSRIARKLHVFLAETNKLFYFKKKVAMYRVVTFEFPSCMVQWWKMRDHRSCLCLFCIKECQGRLHSFFKACRDASKRKRHNTSWKQVRLDVAASSCHIEAQVL